MADSPVRGYWHKGCCADFLSGMDHQIVECLSCGQQRMLARPDGRTVTAGECPRCGYVGWAPRTDITERVRKLLRDVPVPLRGTSRSAA